MFVKSWSEHKAGGPTWQVGWVGPALIANIFSGCHKQYYQDKLRQFWHSIKQSIS
jgi:hypothetical protein